MPLADASPRHWHTKVLPKSCEIVHGCDVAWSAVRPSCGLTLLAAANVCAVWMDGLLGRSSVKQLDDAYKQLLAGRAEEALWAYAKAAEQVCCGSVPHCSTCACA